MNPSVPTPDLNSPGPSLAASLANAPVDTQRLTELLAQEFEALKTRDIPGFEALQVERNQILHRLAFVAEWAAHQNPPPCLMARLASRPAALQARSFSQHSVVAATVASHQGCLAIPARGVCREH